MGNVVGIRIIVGKTKSRDNAGRLMGATATNNVLTVLVTVKLEAILNYCEHVALEIMGKTTLYPWGKQPLLLQLFICYF